MRGFDPSDVEAAFAYASDPEATAYMAWDRHRTIADAHTFLAMVAREYQREDLIYALCLRSAPDAVIGAISVCWHNENQRVKELGYILAKEHWGQGLLPEAGRALVRFAFETTNVERIFAPIFAENTKSRRAAEKIGMKLDGVLRSTRELRGRRWDEAIYSILRSDPR